MATISAKSLAVQIYNVQRSKIHEKQQCSGWVATISDFFLLDSVCVCVYIFSLPCLKGRWLPSVTCALSPRLGWHKTSRFTLLLLLLLLLHHFSTSPSSIFFSLLISSSSGPPFPFHRAPLGKRVWNAWLFTGNQRKHLDRSHTPSIPASSYLDVILMPGRRSESGCNLRKCLTGRGRLKVSDLKSTKSSNTMYHILYHKHSTSNHTNNNQRHNHVQAN